MTLPKLGAAVRASLLTSSDPRYRDTFLRHYGSLTPENEMKMDALQPERGRYDFADADRLMAFAEANGKQVRGHTAVWHRQLPRWVTESNWGNAEAATVLEDHVRTVVRRYRGRIAEWDVVNEPLEDDGGPRSSVWQRALGDDYMAAALRWAHDADASAKLYINDYNIEWFGPKSDRLYAIAGNMVSRGVPLHGIGFQLHVSTTSYPRQAQMLANLARFTELGLRVDITELDVGTSGTPGGVAAKLAAQREVYRSVAAVCQALRECRRITTWGITDASTWRGTAELPLPFDTSYRPKPAFAALVETLVER
jgi:endo-1,4-beta-xylanase